MDNAGWYWCTSGFLVLYFYWYQPNHKRIEGSVWTSWCYYNITTFILHRFQTCPHYWYHRWMGLYSIIYICRFLSLLCSCLMIILLLLLSFQFNLCNHPCLLMLSWFSLFLLHHFLVMTKFWCWFSRSLSCTVHSSCPGSPFVWDFNFSVTVLFSTYGNHRYSHRHMDGVPKQVPLITLEIFA